MGHPASLAAGDMFCTECGSALKATQPFCTGCGTKRVEQVAHPPPPEPKKAVESCSGCGAEFVEGNAFCIGCGTKRGELVQRPQDIIVEAPSPAPPRVPVPIYQGLPPGSGLFADAPLGYVKDGNWHVPIPHNFPKNGLDGWSKCAFMTVTPDRRYVPVVVKDSNVGPGDIAVLPYPQPPADHLVKCVFKVIMPCLFGDALAEGWWIQTPLGNTMRLFPPVGVKPGEEFWVEELKRMYCGCTEDQCATVSSVAFAVCWLGLCALKVAKEFI